MKLVVNSNRVVAALIKDSVSRKLLLNPKFKFVGVYFSQKEVKKYEKMILLKAGITSAEFRKIFDLLFDKINLFDEHTISAKHFKIAHKIMFPIDETDTPFLALALQEKCPIWSDDKHFQEQKEVKIYTTEQLMNQT